jgi:hypothetical protein
MKQGAALQMADVVSYGVEAEHASQRQTAVHLARFLLRPVDFVHRDHWACLGLPEVAIERMNGAGRFRRAINAALGDLLLADYALDATAAAGLGAARESRLGVLLLVVPIEAVLRLATLLAAAVVSGRLTRLLRQSDIRSARAVLGDDAFDFAISEAPLMFSDLSGLDTDRMAPLPQPFDAFAVATMTNFIAHIAPHVADLFRLRFAAVTLPSPPPRLTASHVNQALRLILRKEPSWSASID